MLYKCIKCETIWGDLLPGEAEYEISHGYCASCLKEQIRELVRNKQEKLNGYFCFDTNNCECINIKCEYREICQGDS